MPYVERNGAGRVVGLYANLQEGFAEEWLDDAAPDVAAFRDRPLVPARVTMRQARLALLAAGKLAAVDAAIDTLPEPRRSAARIEWEYSQEVQRDKPFVQMLAPALELDDAALDALFVQAASL